MEKQVDKREFWWVWEWDHQSVKDCRLDFTSVSRWRRGWVTLYKLTTEGDSQWWVYLPFNIGFGFSFPKGK
jgi:hypothetical protein